MTYALKSVTIRTDNSAAGMRKIDALWNDIMAGKIPMQFIENGRPVGGLSPVSRYDEYESDEKGAYDLTVMCVPVSFFAEMERKTAEGLYCKFDESGKDIAECAEKTWRAVWQATADGRLTRAFTADYESTVPAAYTKDGQAHCYLYIAVR